MKSSKGIMIIDRQKPRNLGNREIKFLSGKCDDSKPGKAIFEVNYPRYKKSLETGYSLPKKTTLSSDKPLIVPILEQCSKTVSHSSRSKSPHRDFQETLPSHKKKIENAVKHIHTSSKHAAPESPPPQLPQGNASLEGIPDAAQNAEQYITLQCLMKVKLKLSPLLDLTQREFPTCVEEDINLKRLMKDKLKPSPLFSLNQKEFLTCIEEDITLQRLMKDKLKPSPLFNLTQRKFLTCIEVDVHTFEMNGGKKKASQEEVLGINKTAGFLNEKQKKVLELKEDVSLLEAEGEILSQKEIIDPEKGVLGSKKALESQGGESILQDDELQVLETSAPCHKLSVPYDNADSLCSYRKCYATENNVEEMEMQEELVKVINSGEVEIQDEAKIPVIKTSEPLQPDQEYDNINHAKNDPAIKQTPLERQETSSTEIQTKGNQRKRGCSYLAATPHSNEDMHKKHKSYSMLYKPEEETPISQKSSGKIRNKRKLFDPTAKEHVEIKTPSEEETSSLLRNQSKQSEGLDEGSKTSQLVSIDSRGKTTTPGDEMDKAKSVKKKTGRRYFFSKRNRSANTSISNREKGSYTELSKNATYSPKKARMPHIEDTFFNDKPNTVFSDLESSPTMEVDSLVTERIARYNRVPYQNTSNKKSLERERKSHGKDKELRQENVYDFKSSSNLSDISFPKSTKRKATEEMVKPKDSIYYDRETTECTDTLTCLKRKKSLRSNGRSFFSSSSWSSTSDISMINGHDEWMTHSADKKKNFPLKEDKEWLVLKNSKEGQSRFRKGIGLKGKTSNYASELQVEKSTSLYEQVGVSGNNSKLLESIDTLRDTSRNYIDASKIEFIDLKLTASKAKTNSIRGIHPPLTVPDKSSAGPNCVPLMSSPVPKTSQESIIPLLDQQILLPILQSVFIEPQPPSPIPSTSPQTPVHLPENSYDKPANCTLQPFANISETQKHSTHVELSPIASQASHSPTLTQSFEVPPPLQQGFEDINIREILNPEIDTHDPVSGHFQSTSVISNSASPATSVPSVTPTTTVLPQSDVGLSEKGRNLTRQAGPDSNITKPSFRGHHVSAVVPNESDLFGAASRQQEPKKDWNSLFGNIRMDMLTCLTACSTDLRNFSISACRLSQLLTTLVNKIREEHHEEQKNAVQSSRVGNHQFSHHGEGNSSV